MRPSRPRVLIVDDQAANIELLAEALGEAYELFAATSADRAIELANASVDLILMDVVMPGQNGFELCQILKARAKTRTTPVIFVTALGEVEDEARGFEVGGVDYITKPISPPTVRARVRTHLELRGAQKRLEKEAEVLAENLRLKEHVDRLSRHDLKTPLTSVISIPQILLDTHGLTEEQRGMLRAVEAAGYRILDMVNRSLDLFRMESGVYEFQPARVDLRALAERVISDLQPLARERDVRFDLKGDGAEPPMAMAEELLSYSMLANLIKNAIEASPRGGVVGIAVESEAEETSVAVRNSGAVPLALREGFFRKYASSGKKSGSGLGAYSARLMAEAQRGRIEMETSDDAGTVVTVRLETSRSSSSGSESRSLASSARDVALSGVRVLIADDDEPTRFVLSRFIGPAASVAFALDGPGAIARAATFHPHVVFVDAEMPGLDGFEVATRLRAAESDAEGSRPYLIGLSSHDDAATRSAFLRAGCDVVLVKPVTRPAVLDAVASALEQSGMARRGEGGEEVVRIDADIVRMIPAFLESRREHAREMAVALEARDVERARSLAHKLRGGLEMCGFVKAGALSRGIEEALAGGESPERIDAQVRVLRAYLDEVRYEGIPAESREKP